MCGIQLCKLCFELDECNVLYSALGHTSNTHWAIESNRRKKKEVALSAVESSETVIILYSLYQWHFNLWAKNALIAGCKNWFGVHLIQPMSEFESNYDSGADRQAITFLFSLFLSLFFLKLFLSEGPASIRISSLAALFCRLLRYSLTQC